MNSKQEAGKGTVVVVDKFTGEVREGGPELFKEMLADLAQEREMFLASDNPCYLVGKVKQNEGAFDADEIKRMLDATFECACRRSCDAWYPNQYALALAHATSEDAEGAVSYFLSNFELGLRTSGERAVKHLGKGDWLKESRQLDARLDDLCSMKQLTGDDYRDIVAHVAGHPRFSEAMSWYEKESGKIMKEECTTRGAVPKGASRQTQGDMDRKWGSPEDQAGFDQMIREMEMAGASVLRTLVIQRTDVEKMNLKPYLHPLLSILEDRDTVIRRRQDVRPSISGYDSDPRELYQIPEVRKFLSLLDQQFPYWFYFVDPECGFLPVLIPCLCPLQGVSFSADRSTAKVGMLWKDTRAFLERHFGAMNTILDRFDLDDANDTLNKQITLQVLKALQVPPYGDL